MDIAAIQAGRGFLPLESLDEMDENFEVFQYYQGGYGIEAKLETTLNDETVKWADLTLSAELIEKENSTFQFAYRLIEVM